MSVKVSNEVCPKCQGLVAWHEDSILLRALATQEHDMVMHRGARHIQCDTSIAQYVCHPEFPSIYEDRPQFDKRQGNPEMNLIREEIFTEAWVNLQLSCGITLNNYEHRVYG